MALKPSADMGMTPRALTSLFQGRINDASQLWELKLDSGLIRFADSFQQLPAAQRKWLGLGSLRKTKWHRARFSDKPDVSITHAFELPEKNGKH